MAEGHRRDTTALRRNARYILERSRLYAIVQVLSEGNTNKTNDNNDDKDNLSTHMHAAGHGKARR